MIRKNKNSEPKENLGNYFKPDHLRREIANAIADYTLILVEGQQ